MFIDDMFFSSNQPIKVGPNEPIKIVVHNQGEEGFWRYGVTDDGVLEVTWEKKLVSKS